jgi:signal peptidase I
MQYGEQPFITAPSGLLQTVRSSQQQELVLEALRQTGSVSIRAMGTSMLPGIWPGDVLRIERAAAARIAKGEVVLFERGERLFVHRVREIQTGSGSIVFTTRGDSLPHIDPPFEESALLGRVTQVTRAGRDVPPSQSTGWLDGLVSGLFRRPALHHSLQRLHAWRRRASEVLHASAPAVSVRLP